MLGAAETHPGRGPSRKAQLADGLSAALTGTVGAGGPTGQGSVQFCQLPSCAIGEGSELGAFERDGGAFGVVFVVGVGVDRCLHHRSELELHHGEASAQPVPLAR